MPSTAAASASCSSIVCRAIEPIDAYGAHGLPLMGLGDWNDGGMNRVGVEGRRERLAGGSWSCSTKRPRSVRRDRQDSAQRYQPGRWLTGMLDLAGRRLVLARLTDDGTR